MLLLSPFKFKFCFALSYSSTIRRSFSYKKNPLFTLHTYHRYFFSSSSSSSFNFSSLAQPTLESNITEKDNPPLVSCLAIETSCDDTSVAILTSHRQLLAMHTHHQTKLHEPMGGIVPSAAAASHREQLPLLLNKIFTESKMDPHQIDLIAVTQGPGLAPCLSVGLMAAKTLAAVLDKPLIGVHHMEAHALTPRFSEPTPPSFPYLSLLVSGGHTLLVLTKDVGDHEVLGSTLDDAVGEAFDKVARYLKLPWLATGGGAGAAVEQAASHASTTVPFSVPMTQGRATPGLDFSFSGLKSQVHRHLALHPTACPYAIAHGFQTAAVAHLVDRVRRALRVHTHITTLVVAGGVAANTHLQAQLRDAMGGGEARKVVVPPASLCSDNAAMIGWAAVERWVAKGKRGDAFGIDVKPTWGLNQLGKEEGGMGAESR